MLGLRHYSICICMLQILPWFPVPSLRECKTESNSPHFPVEKLSQRAVAGPAQAPKGAGPQVPSPCPLITLSHLLQQVLKSTVVSSASGHISGVRFLCFLPAANFVQDETIRLDISLASVPLIKANYLESHHKVK